MSRSAALLTILALAGGLNARDPIPGATGEPEPRANPNVGIEQKLGDQVPLDLSFTDEDGNAVTLGDCVGGKPTILILAYYRCPMLCGEVLAGVLDACRNMKTMTIGKEFNVVTVSFDPKEKPGLALAKKRHFVSEYGRKEADTGWKFLTGEADNIAVLAKAVGFKYEFDKSLKEYNHDSAIMIVTPEGILSRYFPGIEYMDRGDNGQLIDDSTRTLRLSLVEAGDGKIGSLSDRAFLSCYRYNGHTGKYSANILLMMRMGGGLTLLVVLGLYGWKCWHLPGVRVLEAGVLTVAVGLLAAWYVPVPSEEWAATPQYVIRTAVFVLLTGMFFVGRMIWRTAEKPATVVAERDPMTIG